MDSSEVSPMPRRWSKYVCDVYDPVQVGSIDGTDQVPHDRALIRAINSNYRPNRKVKGNPLHTIFIGRLAHSVTEVRTHTHTQSFQTIAASFAK